MITKEVSKLKFEIGVLKSELDEARYELGTLQARINKLTIENTYLKGELERAKKEGCVVVTEDRNIRQKLVSYSGVISTLLKNKQ